MSTVEPRSPLPGAAWTSAEPPRDRRRETAIARFLGGSPAAVFLRLILLSFLVGALLMWLDIRPQDVLFAFERFVRRVWALGFDAIRDSADYVVAGALIVVPVWFVVRLLNMRSLR